MSDKVFNKLNTPRKRRQRNKPVKPKPIEEKPRPEHTNVEFSKHLATLKDKIKLVRKNSKGSQHSPTISERQVYDDPNCELEIDSINSKLKIINSKLQRHNSYHNNNPSPKIERIAPIRRNNSKVSRKGLTPKNSSPLARLRRTYSRQDIHS